MRKGFVIVLAILMLMGTMGCSGTRGDPIETISPEEQKYQEAKMNYDQGEWYAAWQLFREIEEHSNAKQLTEDCLYLSIAQEICDEAITSLKNKLKNPSSLEVNSVEFKAEYNYEYTVIEINIKIDYSAQNGFGGYNRSNHYEEMFLNTYSKYTTINEDDANSSTIFILRFNQYMESSEHIAMITDQKGE